MKVWDVIIIGGGAIGAAAAFFLKKKDPSKECLLIERRDGFGRGATGAWGSLIRVISIRAGVSEKAARALPYFLNFEENVGKPCGFVQTGCLYFFAERHKAEFEKKLEKLQGICESEIRLLGAEEGRIEFPEFQWLDGDYAIYEPQGGYASPGDTTGAWIGGATQRGLESIKSKAVKRILSGANEVTGVELDSEETILAKRVLLAGGVGTTRLTNELEIPLDTYARPLQVNRFHFRSSRNNLPIFLDHTTGSFARPAEEGVLYGGYLKDKAPEVSGDRQPLSLNEAAEAKKRLSHRLKTLRTSELAGGVRTLELYSNGEEPVLGFSERFGNLYLATGWSCTGFTLSPYYGERIADEILRSFE